MEADGSASNETLRRDILSLAARLSQINHYQLLGVDLNANRQVVLEARNLLTRRLTVALRVFPREVGAKVELIRKAVDAAYTTLADPTLRATYDRTLGPKPNTTKTTFTGRELNAEQVRAALSPPVSPRLSRADRAQEVFHRPPQPIVTNTVQEPPLPQPTRPTLPLAKTPSEPIAVASIKRTGEMPTTVAPHDATQTPQVASLKQTMQMFPAGSESAGAPRRPTDTLTRRSTELQYPANTMSAPVEQPTAVNDMQRLQAEFDTLLYEVDKLTASVQHCVAYIAELDTPRRSHFVSTFHALSSTRGSLAAMLAAREERSGNWGAAAKLWQRAARARPSETSYPLRAAAAAVACSGAGANDAPLRDSVESPTLPLGLQRTQVAAR
jgi:hypothetical protein